MKIGYSKSIINLFYYDIIHKKKKKLISCNVAMINIEFLKLITNISEYGTMNITK